MAEFINTTLVDGYAGGPHITEVQIGLANQADFGPDDYVLEGGREAEAQVLTNNSIRIFDAVFSIQGRRDVVAANNYTDVTIDNGAQGVNRNDIIVRRYTKDEVTEVEACEYAVLKGTASSGTPVDPEITIGDIRSGATLHEMALYRVKIEGLNIVEVEPLFQVLMNKASMQQMLAELNGKLQKDDDFTETTVNGWVVRYKKIGMNLLHLLIYKNITGQQDQHRTNIGVTIPFTLPFQQHFYCNGNTAGLPTALAMWRINEDGSIMLGCQGYSGTTTYCIEGIVVINE